MLPASIPVLLPDPPKPQLLHFSQRPFYPSSSLDQNPVHHGLFPSCYSLHQQIQLPLPSNSIQNSTSHSHPTYTIWPSKFAPSVYSQLCSQRDSSRFVHEIKILFAQPSQHFLFHSEQCPNTQTDFQTSNYLSKLMLSFRLLLISLHSLRCCYFLNTVDILLHQEFCTCYFPACSTLSLDRCVAHSLKSFLSNNSLLMTML